MGIKLSRSETIASAENMLHFISALRDNLEELHDYPTPWLHLQQGLSYLSRFLWDITTDRTPLGELISLQSHLEALFIEAAIAIYSYDEKLDKTTAVDRVSFVLVKINNFKVDVDLIQLLNSEANIIAPLKDLIDYFQEELLLLKTSAMDALEQCKEQAKIVDFLILIQFVTSQACSIISSLSHNAKKEDLSREINCLHFQLLLKFKFIKAVIRQICPKISASSSLDRPMINLLNFLPVNFGVVDSYFSMPKSSEVLSSDSHNMYLVLEGFHEYILENLLLKDETNLTFFIANEVKKF